MPRHDTLFPYTTLFRSRNALSRRRRHPLRHGQVPVVEHQQRTRLEQRGKTMTQHTSPCFTADIRLYSKIDGVAAGRFGAGRNSFTFFVSPWAPAPASCTRPPRGRYEIGRAPVCTPVTHAPHVSRYLLANRS